VEQISRVQVQPAAQPMLACSPQSALSTPSCCLPSRRPPPQQAAVAGLLPAHAQRTPRRRPLPAARNHAARTHDARRPPPHAQHTPRPRPLQAAARSAAGRRSSDGCADGCAAAAQLRWMRRRQKRKWGIFSLPHAPSSPKGHIEMFF